MTTTVTLQTSLAPFPLVTAVPTSSSPVQVYQAASDPSSDLYARQHWGLELSAVNAAGSGLFWACAFTIAVPGKPMQAITFNGDKQPLLLNDYAPANSKQWCFMRDYQTNGNVVLLGQQITGTSALCMDLSAGGTSNGNPVQGWQYQQNNANQLWKLSDALERPTSVRSDLTQIVQGVLATVPGNPTFASVLLSDPAPVFVAAGYPLHDNDYNGFNQFFIHNFKTNIETWSRNPAAIDPNWVACMTCKTTLYVFALGIAVLAGGGLALLTETASPVIALGAAIGISARVTAGMLLGLGTAIVSDTLALLSQLCTWVHACRE
jgi:hypothetical protein